MMNESFPDRLKRLRTERDLSQDQLADLAGITKGYVSHLETGARDHKRMGNRTLFGLCRALRVSWPTLLLGRDAQGIVDIFDLYPHLRPTHYEAQEIPK